MGYQGIFNYNLLLERIELRKEISKNSKNLNVKKVIFSESSNDKFLAISNYIETNFSYLNPNYSLELLASDLKMSTSSVSKIINTGCEYNFSDYINSLRVAKAKEYLISPDFKKYTILSIGLECGFNSKSTFYLAFKNFLNTTPTEYRKRNS